MLYLDNITCGREVSITRKEHGKHMIPDTVCYIHRRRRGPGEEVPERVQLPVKELADLEVSEKKEKTVIADPVPWTDDENPLREGPTPVQTPKTVGPAPVRDHCWCRESFATDGETVGETFRWCNK
ncbi:hypothetical protein QR680_011417 [Steinernema hermaphroditum]|uniref:Uncharacterized protein n=1 Tax=Steinernema hermaphroditum TaxID=289476 RepID=A0AA39HZN3_9BILA|nr:hypothetical protein QR680_011417 [Steinernema hermaphroditum]